MNTDQLAKAWEELSAAQREAAKWEQGSLLVLAGPGSGKTRVLTCRIACLLDASRNENFRVLGLTFTNKAADEMRSRVESYVPDQKARLFLSTFHSFCADVLRQHGTHLGINPNFRIYSREADLQAILNDAVEESKSESNGQAKVSDLDKKTLPVIKNLKSHLVFPDQAMEVFKDKRFGERMAIVYPAYEKQLLEHNALDFESLILKTFQLFTQFPALAKRYRIVYPYLCIDEFQDTNPAQYRLIRAFTGDEYRNVFVVADDDQIIYQWNGASHKRMEEFRRDYSPTVMQLPVNYRCPPEIVKLANNLIQHNFLRTPDKKPLEAFRSPSGPGTVRLLPSFSDFDAEAAGVAFDIRQLHSSELGSVVVLARSRRLLNIMDQALRESGLPAIISQRKDEFESAPFVWLYAILNLANDRQDRNNLESVCGAFSQLAQIEVDAEDVITQARSSNSDYLQHWLKLAHPKAVIPSARAILDQTTRYLGQGRDFRAFNNAALEWFTQLTRDDSSTASDPLTEQFVRYGEERDVWNELTREITRSLGSDLTLEAFLQEIEMRSKEPAPKADTVILMTIHGAKGKEFGHVYLVGMVEDELPSFQSRQRGNDSPEMEEERRDCFVAITRTMKTLTLSYANRYKGWTKKPSRFLYEMGLLATEVDSGTELVAELSTHT